MGRWPERWRSRGEGGAAGAEAVTGSVCSRSAGIRSAIGGAHVGQGTADVGSA
jgi:hypothetical protein